MGTVMDGSLDRGALYALALRLYEEGESAKCRTVVGLLLETGVDCRFLLLDLLCLVELGETDRARALYDELERLVLTQAATAALGAAQAVAIKRVFDRACRAVHAMTPRDDEARRQAERMIPRLPRQERAQ